MLKYSSFSFHYKVRAVLNLFDFKNIVNVGLTLITFHKYRKIFDSDHLIGDFRLLNHFHNVPFFVSGVDLNQWYQYPDCEWQGVFNSNINPFYRKFEVLYDLQNELIHLLVITFLLDVEKAGIFFISIKGLLL